MNKLAEVVKRRREALGLSQAALAKLAGVSTGTIGNIESGMRGRGDQIPGSLHKVADALGTTTDDLLKEAGVIKVTGKKRRYDVNVEHLQPPSSIRAVPRISWVQAGDLAVLEDPYPAGAGEGVEWVDPAYGPYTVALTIKGDSMEPEFRAGDVVIVDPAIEPQPGDYVVAKNSEEEATFKKYRPRGADAEGNRVFELVPLNDDYPTLRSDHDHLQVVGVMVEHRKRRRR